MPKLNSMELKHKRKILNWAGENWGTIKEANKTRIFCALLSKEMPTKLVGEFGGPIILRVIEGNPEQNGISLPAPRFSVQSLQ